MTILKPTLPRLIVAERVARAMFEEAMHHEPTETGQALIGLSPNPETLFVLGVVPDVLDTTRDPAFFAQGGDDQVQIFRWLNKHWEKMRKKVDPASTWKLGDIILKGTIPQDLNIPLRVVGDWHRHPGMYKVLSPHDRSTILSILSDDAQQKSTYLTPIAVLEEERKLEWKLNRDELELSQVKSKVLINWWFNTRENPFWVYKLIPEIVPDQYLPWLPPISWHLVTPNRLKVELTRLEKAGCRVNWTVKEMNGDVHIEELVFGVDHPDWKKRLLLVTQWDYPRSQPTYQIIDKPDQDMKPVQPAVAKKETKKLLPEWLEKIVNRAPKISLWQQGVPVVPTFRLSNQTYLADLVHKLESELKGESDVNTAINPGPY